MLNCLALGQETHMPLVRLINKLLGCAKWTMAVRYLDDDIVCAQEFRDQSRFRFVWQALIDVVIGWNWRRASWDQKRPLNWDIVTARLYLAPKSFQICARINRKQQRSSASSWHFCPTCIDSLVLLKNIQARYQSSWKSQGHRPPLTSSSRIFLIARKPYWNPRSGSNQRGHRSRHSSAAITMLAYEPDGENTVVCLHGNPQAFYPPHTCFEDTFAIEGTIYIAGRKLRRDNIETFPWIS